MEPTRFNGVYTKQYNNIDTIERMVVNTFVKIRRIEILSAKQMAAKMAASNTDNLLVGRGLFIVLVISLSKSFSIIWLMVTDDPDNNSAPRKSMTKVLQFILGDARTNPKAHEKATRNESRNFRSSQ
jgi:hypothetical protein